MTQDYIVIIRAHLLGPTLQLQCDATPTIPRSSNDAKIGRLTKSGKFRHVELPRGTTTKKSIEPSSPTARPPIPNPVGPLGNSNCRMARTGRTVQVFFSPRLLSVNPQSSPPQMSSAGAGRARCVGCHSQFNSSRACLQASLAFD